MAVRTLHSIVFERWILELEVLKCLKLKSKRRFILRSSLGVYLAEGLNEESIVVDPQ
jgi:hypothetical protein